ncbi:hypothetical protein K504DRAFT_138757 [Pleomassaria siparia CBS 279.74]|uniref:Uncharacterized protein n=1 Tax=Pleomassaria siparia CBS 279.74 TaxID=1314801 RepID=A0A6G1KKX6_9PLEO|nr:hypothetical protein K504DRAFT_138757 [Pleomassaria siparia CBS 279.74]
MCGIVHPRRDTYGYAYMHRSVGVEAGRGPGVCVSAQRCWRRRRPVPPVEGHPISDHNATPRMVSALAARGNSSRPQCFLSTHARSLSLHLHPHPPAHPLHLTSPAAIIYSPRETAHPRPGCLRIDGRASCCYRCPCSRFLFQALRVYATFHLTASSPPPTSQRLHHHDSQHGQSRGEYKFISS